MPENINIPDSNITTELSFRNLILMNMQQLTNFPYIENDFDALTDYELLCLVVKYLNDVISNQNEQNASITRLYNSFLALQDYINGAKDELEDAFNELDTYVRTFFANLDVQEEIDNKLDEMVEDGTLPEIIADYLNSKAIFGFDNVESMKNATNLIDGSYAQTLGYYTKNDGGKALYKIRTITNEDVVNNGSIISLNNTTLIAELVKDTMVNVKQFGAYGDNNHDDTLAFQNAINYINENGTIYVPKGEYIISSTLNTKSSISIIGCEDVPKIIFTNTGTLFSISGHNNSNTEYETRPRDSSSEFKPILKQLCLTTGLTSGHGKNDTIAISFDTTSDTIMARGFMENVHIWHFDIGMLIGKYHFYLMNFIRVNFTFNNTAIKTNAERVDSGEKISITDGLFDSNKVCIEFTGSDYDMNILNTSIDFNDCFLYSSGNVVDDSRKIVIDGCHYETNSADYVYNQNNPHGFLFGILNGTSIFITNSKFSTRSADTLFFSAGKSGGTYIHFENNRIEFKAGYYNDVEVVPYLYYFNSDDNFIVTAKNNDSVVFTKPLSFHQAINSVPGISYPYAIGTATRSNASIIMDSANQNTNIYVSSDELTNVASYNITAKNNKTGYKGLQFIPTDINSPVKVIVSEGTFTPIHEKETRRVCIATTNCSKVEYQIAYFDENHTRTHTDSYYVALDNNTITNQTLIIPHCPAINKTNNYLTDKYIKVYARLTSISGYTPELNALVVYTI